MTGKRVEAPDPDDLGAALDRLRDAVFLAIDELGTTTTITRETSRNLVLLGADVYVIRKRQET